MYRAAVTEKSNILFMKAMNRIPHAEVCPVLIYFCWISPRSCHEFYELIRSHLGWKDMRLMMLKNTHKTTE